MICNSYCSQVEEDAVSCSDGGMTNPSEIDSVDFQQNRDKKAKKKTLFGLIILGVILLFSAVLLFLLLGRMSPESTAKAYVDELLKRYTTGLNLKKVYEIAMPPEALKHLATLGDETRSVDEYFSMVQETEDEMHEDYIKNFGGVIINFDTQALASNNFTSDELDVFIQMLKNIGLSLDIKEAKHVTIKVTTNIVSGSTSSTITITAYRVNEKWYANDQDNALSEFENSLRSIYDPTY